MPADTPSTVEDRDAGLAEAASTVESILAGTAMTSFNVERHSAATAEAQVSRSWDVLAVLYRWNLWRPTVRCGHLT